MAHTAAASLSYGMGSLANPTNGHSGSIHLDSGTASITDSASVDEEYITTFFVRALYDYQSNDPSSLSFRKSDVIEVLTRLESGWWDGLLNDERGWFPSNYVEVLETSEVDAILRQQSREEQSSIAPSHSADSIVDMASVMGQGQNGSWMDPEMDLRNALVSVVRQQQGQQQSVADFWLPNVGADGRIYYVNTQTGEESLFPPADDLADSDLAGLSPAQTSRAGGANLGFASRGDNDGLKGTPAGFGTQKRGDVPEPWIRKLADDGLSYYYWNKVTGDVQRTLPEPKATQTNGYPSARNHLGDGATSSVTSMSSRPYDTLRSESAMSQSQETSAGNRTSVYSDVSDVQPRPGSRSAVPNPLQKSIEQARKNGTIELTTAEQAASALQQTMTAPVPESIATLAQNVGAAINALVQSAPEADLQQPHQARDLQERVGAVVTAIRDLLYVTSLPSGTIPDETDSESARSQIQAHLKPTQRKVTATLSKLVLSVRALQYDAETPVDSAAAKVDADAQELDRALRAFVADVQRLDELNLPPAKRVRGAFSSDNLGVGLVGGGAAASWKGFGWVPVDDEHDVPANILGSPILNELRATVRQLNDQLGRFGDLLRVPAPGMAAQVAGHARDVISDYSKFLAFVADICVARHVDIDGIQRQPGQTAAHDAYMKTVDNARSFVRLLEVSVQSIYDDSASLLLTMQALRQANQEQSDRDRASCYSHLLSLATAMESNTRVVEQTLESLLKIGVEQLNMAAGDYNGSIGWRMSRVSVIENTLRPLVTPNTARGFDDDSVVDMELAFGRRGGNRAPPMGDRTGSDESHSGNEDLPPTPTWESAGQSMDNLVPDESPALSTTQLDDEADLDDEDDLTGATKIKGRGNKLLQMLGQEVGANYYVKELTQNEKPWYMRTTTDPSEIVFDSKDGAVKGGTVPALVERLTSHESPDTKFIKTFMMTWKSFTTLDQLIELLIQRYSLEPPPDLKPTELEDWTVHKQHVIRTRVLNTMKTMVQDEDDVMDSEDLIVLDRMKAFVTSDQLIDLPAAKQTLQWIKRAQSGDATLKRTAVNPTPAPAPIIPRSLNKKLKLLDIDPLELARQLTIMESQQFLKIRPMECILRSREQRSGRVDHIHALIQITNQVSCWVADCILAKEDSKRRAAVIKHFIQCADRCRQLNNFSTMIALVSGMNGPAIRRLKRTWEQVNQRSSAQLAVCEGTMDSGKNFQNYRNVLAKVQPPCIPFFGLYLTQLTFIQDGNADTLEGGLTNFSKRNMAAEVINDMKRWQARPYNLTPVPGILGFLEDSLSQYTESERLKDEFWELSLEREPREREDEKMARLLQESGFL